MGDRAINPEPVSNEPAAPVVSDVPQVSEASKPRKAAQSKGNSAPSIDEPSSAKAKASIADIMAPSDEDEPPAATRAEKRKGSRKAKSSSGAIGQGASASAASAADVAVLSPRKGLKRDAKRGNASATSGELQSQQNETHVPDKDGSAGAS